MKEEYTIKEILLAYRKEYLKMQGELDGLKQHCTVSKFKVYDYHFFLCENAFHEVGLACDYIPKSFRLQTMEQYQGRVFFHPAFLLHEDNQYEIAGDHYPIEIGKTKSDVQEFREKADAILHSEFAKKIRGNMRNLCDISSSSYIKVASYPEQLRIFGMSMKKIPVLKFRYLATRDELMVEDDSCGRELALATLENITIPVENLHSYQRRVLEDHVCSMPLMMEDWERPGRVVLKIDEQKDHVALLKKTKK